jgi:hypothetical protein
MKHFRTYAAWGLAALALLVSPIVMIVGIPLAIGIGLDIFDFAGGGPVALALCVPVIFVLLRRALSRQRIRMFLRSRLHPGHAAEPG